MYVLVDVFRYSINYNMVSGLLYFISMFSLFKKIKLLPLGGAGE